MRIILTAVNAKYIHSNPAVYSISAYAKKRHPNTDVSICEYTINQDPDFVLRELLEKAPDLLAFSCYIWNISFVKTILPQLHHSLPDCRLWLGGPEVSPNAPELLKEFPYLSGIMIGEGEQSFSQLISAYESDPEPTLDGIPGICLPGMSGREISPAPPLSMDELPFFYEDLLPTEDSPFRNRIIYYESSRGCPFRCSYCLSSIEKDLRFRSLDNVKEELLFFLQQKVRQVKFIDRTFNCDRKRAIELWQFLIKNDNGITNFHFEIDGALLDAESLRTLSMARRGLIRLEIGVQSTNPSVLRAVNRNSDIQKLKENVALLKRYGNCNLHMDLIAGLPGEALQSFICSFNELFAMAPDELQLGFLKVLKGTPIEQDAEKFGLRYKKTPPYEVIETAVISPEELAQLHEIEEMVEIFYNSRQFCRTLAVVTPLYDTVFTFFDRLSGFIHTHDFSLQSGHREDRYLALLAFLLQDHPQYRVLFSELLTFDYVLREKPLHRPDFFGAHTPFVKNGRRIHVESFSYNVWELTAPEQAVHTDQRTPIVFDYEKRDVFTNNAAFDILT